MESPNRPRKKRGPDNPQTDNQSGKPASQGADESANDSVELPALTPLHQSEQRSEQDSTDVKVISNPLEHQLLEMESQLSHELDTMQSKIDSGFSRLHDDVSDLSDSLKESMDQLENTVDRFTSTVKWYIVIAGGTAVLVIVLLLWGAFFN